MLLKHQRNTHACRHGVPAEVYIDQGTQLKALEHAKFSIKDLGAQVDDALGIRIIASNAKSQEESGPIGVLADEDVDHQLSRDSSEDENIGDALDRRKGLDCDQNGILDIIV